MTIIQLSWPACLGILRNSITFTSSGARFFLTFGPTWVTIYSSILWIVTGLVISWDYQVIQATSIYQHWRIINTARPCHYMHLWNTLIRLKMVYDMFPHSLILPFALLFSFIGNAITNLGLPARSLNWHNQHLMFIHWFSGPGHMHFDLEPVLNRSVLCRLLVEQTTLLSFQMTAAHQTQAFILLCF